MEHFFGRNDNNKAQILIDVLLGLSLVILSVSAVIVLIYGSQGALIDRTDAKKARALVEEGIKAGELIVKNNWDSINDGNYGLSFTNGAWSFSGTENTQGIYTRRIIVETIDDEQKKIKSIVSWSSSGRAMQIERVSLVTNWETVIDTGGDTGGSGLSGNWVSPYTLGSVDLGAGTQATALDVKNKIVYITTEAAAASKPDFFIIDATNGEAPQILSSLNTGPSLLSIDVAGQYAYVGNKNTDAQLQIIAITNLSTPQLVSSFQLPGVSGIGAVGQSIFYSASRLYIGTKRATGPEFHIIDVSNPASPYELGFYEINGDVNAIFVENNTAFLTTSLDTELKILDISNPADILEISNFDAPGNSEDGKSSHLVGTKLYFGRTVGSNHSNHHEFHIIDVSTSSLPQNLGSRDLATDVNDLVVRDNLVFLATSDSNKEVQIFDISNPISINLVSSFNFPQMATSIDYEDNFLYVSVRSNDGLRIITSSP